MLKPSCKQVASCVCPINDTDKYANKNVNPAFRNVQCEASVYEYTGLILNIYEQLTM